MRKNIPTIFNCLTLSSLSLIMRLDSYSSDQSKERKKDGKKEGKKYAVWKFESHKNIGNWSYNVECREKICWNLNSFRLRQIELKNSESKATASCRYPHLTIRHRICFAFTFLISFNVLGCSLSISNLWLCVYSIYGERTTGGKKALIKICYITNWMEHIIKRDEEKQRQQRAETDWEIWIK